MTTRHLFCSPSARQAVGLLGISLALATSAAFAQEPAPSAPVRASGKGTEQQSRKTGESDVSAAATLSFYRQPGAAVDPLPRPGPCGEHYLPLRTPWPCGGGPSDCCVGLPCTGFLYYGTNPRDDDPVNHTWTRCVGDAGNHAARKTVRHKRRFGY